MKKIFLFFIASTITLTTFSQNHFGVFAGVNYSYFTDGFAGKIYAEDSFGIQIGMLYNMELAENISFRPKLSFSQQGDNTRTEQTNNLELNEIDYKLTYINTSLDIKFWDKIYLLAGPQLGFLVNQTKLSRDVGEIESNIDFGLNLGGGFKVNKLFFELGIYQGVTTLLKYDYYTGGTTKVKNGHAKFTVGYNF